MPQQRYKRFRMQIDLRTVDLPAATLPDGYRWIPWRPITSDRHAQIKWRSFRHDLDGRVFPCLSHLEGCRRLISEIARQPKFSPNGTWMICFQPELSWPADDCATIQSIARTGGVGSIQNVGVVPEHRGFGLGRSIVLKTLEAFWHDGLTHASLEVTAVNRAAVSLYRSLGFRVTRVLYRASEGGKVIQGSERPPEQAEQLSAP